MSDLLDSLATLPTDERHAAIDELSDQEAVALLYDWSLWARENQLPPAGDWFVWLIQAGRGFGKTRSGTHWFHDRAMTEQREMALVAATPADARDYMIQGPGGILRNVWPNEKPHYEPSKRRLTWPNGSTATIYSAQEPDQLRGFSGDTAWLDEFAKWPNPRECWDNLLFGMRETSADHPRICITTTPRPLAILNEIREMTSSVVATGSSYENRANLDPVFYQHAIAPYEGTSLGQQEIYGQIIDANPGALWNRAMIDDHRVDEAPDLERIVVAIDPAVTAHDESDETGIVMAGKAGDHAYVLKDVSGRMSPHKWADRAVNLYHASGADRIVGEQNNGGDLVETNIRSVDPEVSYQKVTASRGKRIRAEPVAALYEQGRVHHVGAFDDLEDQCCNFDPETYDSSPDRLDALVWAITQLMLQKTRNPRIRTFD